MKTTKLAREIVDRYFLELELDNEDRVRWIKTLLDEEDEIVEAWGERERSRPLLVWIRKRASWFRQLVIDGWLPSKSLREKENHENERSLHQRPQR